MKPELPVQREIPAIQEPQARKEIPGKPVLKAIPVILVRKGIQEMMEKVLMYIKTQHIGR